MSSKSNNALNLNNNPVFVQKILNLEVVYYMISATPNGQWLGEGLKNKYWLFTSIKVIDWLILSKSLWLVINIKDS